MYQVLCLLSLLVLSVACGQHKSGVQRSQESLEAKRLLQGVWSDEETEDVVFKMSGDSVFYADSTSMPAVFWVVDDTLVIGTTHYHIEKHSEHVLWFTSPNGELIKIVKVSEGDSDVTFTRKKAQVQTLTEVVKSDTVVFYEGTRYHLYIAVNPTKYKVVRYTLNDDGMDVENVYYDNIIHLSVFQGARQLFSRDFRKSQYQRLVSKPFLEQAVLNNMKYVKTDKKGFHVNVSLCAPGDASCYMVEHVVGFDGELLTELRK